MTRRRWSTVVAVWATIATLGIVSAPAVHATTACSAWCGGGEYHPVPAVRIVDTASRPTGPTGPSFDLAVLGRAGVPATATDVVGVVITLHVLSPTTPTWARVWGAAPGVGAPAAQVYTQRAVGNAATVVVRPNAAGAVRVQLVSAAKGNARVVVTVAGWISTSTYRSDDTTVARGGRWVLQPTATRLYDSRHGTQPDTPLGAAASRGLAVAGVAGVPSDGTAVAALLSVSAVSATAAGYLTVLPQAPTVRPRSLDVPVLPGVPRTNLVVAPIGADGSVYVYNYSGTVNYTVDLVGYVHTGDTEATRAGRIIPLATSFRVLDTRQAAFGATPLAAAHTEDWSFASFVNSVSLGGTWVGRQAGLVGSVTSVRLTRTVASAPPAVSSLTLYAGATAVPPLGPSLPTREGVATSMPVAVRYGVSSTVRVRNAAGNAHYTLDVVAVVLAD